MLGLSRARGARALRRDHRVRRARGVPRPQAQELLVRACTCGWRSRSRSQVDADVLLIDEVLAVGDAAFQQKCFDQFHALKAAGTHDRLRHARHERRRALLRPRDAARARPDRRASATRTTIARAYNELNFGRSCTTTPEGARYGDQTAAEITARLVRGRRRRADRRARPGRAAAASRWRSASTRRSTSRSSASRCATRPATRLRDAHRLQRRRRPATSRPATSAIVRVALDNWLAPGALPAHAVARPRRRGRRRRARPARGPRVADRARHAATPAASSTCRTRSRSSAR